MLNLHSERVDQVTLPHSLQRWCCLRIVHMRSESVCVLGVIKDFWDILGHWTRSTIPTVLQRWDDTHWYNCMLMCLDQKFLVGGSGIGNRFAQTFRTCPTLCETQCANRARSLAVGTKTILIVEPSECSARIKAKQNWMVNCDFG